jgi:integrase
MRKPSPTVRQIQDAQPGRVYYGENLLLLVRPNGTRTWTLRYTSPVRGKVTETSLGPWPAYSYSDARQAATQMQMQIAKGIDPVLQKRQERANQIPWHEVCDQWIAVGQASWSKSQMRNMHLRLKVHGKALMSKSVAHIDAAMVTSAIKPLMASHPRQGRRTLAVWARVFAFAEHKRWRRGDNPARWQNNMSFAFHGANKLPNKNFAAMSYQAVPAFIQRLRQLRCTGAAALETVILTASRTSEVREMRWDEVDWDKKLWTIPTYRMKTRQEHTIPLSDRALELLRREQEHANGPYVFLGRYRTGPLDNKTMLRLLNDMGEQVTTHGFRASFKTWGLEQGYRWDVVELCLGHKVGSKVAQAYLRGTAIQERRETMAAWAQFCNGHHC